MQHEKFRRVLRSTAGAVILMPAIALAQGSSSSSSGQGTQSGSQGSQTGSQGSHSGSAQQSGSKQHSGAKGSGSEDTQRGSSAQGSQGSASGSSAQGSGTTSGSSATGTSSAGSQSATGGSQSASLQPGSSARSSSGSQTIDPTEVQRVFGSDATIIDLQTLGTEQIRSLQQSLQDRGHYKGQIDGVYGPQTRAGLKAMLQQQYSLNQRLINQGQVTGPLASTMGLDQSDVSPVSGSDARSGDGSSIRSQPSTQGTPPSGSNMGTSPSGTSGAGRSSGSSPSGSSPSGTSPSGSMGAGSGGTSGSSGSGTPSGSAIPR